MKNRSWVGSLHEGEEGQNVAEYGFILGLLGIAAIAALTHFSSLFMPIIYSMASQVAAHWFS